MKWTLTIIFFFFVVFLSAQTTNKKEDCITQFDTISNRIVYTNVDTMPEFQGGNGSLIQFLHDNIRRPKVEDEIVGFVYLSFIVETDGSLTNKKILKSLDEDFDKEGMRLIDIMPKWKVGKCNGVVVPVRIIIPIKFSVE